MFCLLFDALQDFLVLNTPPKKKTNVTHIYVSDFAF